MGERVRYDAEIQALPTPSSHLERWRAEGRLILICPEVAAGLPVPRPPAELQPNGQVVNTLGVVVNTLGVVVNTLGQVVNTLGVDLSETFRRGAELTLAMAQAAGAPLAILKNGSPSCGSSHIHDGSFSGVKISGEGLTTQWLRANGVAVFSETQIEEAAAYLSRLEA